MTSAAPTYAFPLSFAQERLWFLDQLEPGSAAYNDPTALRLRGPLDLAALECALTEIVRRHEVLRTTFTTINGEPRQVVSAPCPVLLPILRELDLVQTLQAEAQEPFDLQRGPLLRAKLVRLADNEHVLLLTLHHIVSDGWSTAILVHELKTLYAAFRDGLPSPLPELAIQYADYAVWQRDWLRGEALQEHLAYWTAQMDGAPPALELCTDYQRRATGTSPGAHYRLDVPAELLEAVVRRGREHGATLFMTLLAAFHVLLHRYSGQDDVVVGSPIAGRTRPETEPLLGFFVNTLALRGRFGGNPTLSSVLRQVRETCLGAFDHQELPFEKLVETVRPARDSNRSPLFQVLFSLQNVPPARFELAGLVVEPLHQETNAAKFDLSLYATERPGGLRLSFEYASDLFAAATIEGLGSHFVRVLQAIANDPDIRVGDIVLVDDDPALHGSPLHVAPATIAQLFDTQAQRTPDALAVRDAHSSLTFDQLRQHANGVAHWLRTRGVGPDVVVAIRCERSVELIVGLLGILKAGGAYLAIEPSLPAERQAFMVADSQAVLVLTEQDLHPRPERDNPDSQTAPEDLAYLIYTSGSTGQPKGVLCTHAAAINRFAWMWNAYPFTPDDVCVQKTALSFVDSVWEIWGPLLQGVPLIILSDTIQKDPSKLIEALAEHRVTRIVLVPSWLALLLDTQPNLSQTLPTLRWCTSSGETLPPDIAARFRECMPHTRLLNLYGSSEVAADVTAFEVPSGPPAVSIGEPISNTRLYLLDRYLQAVPRGVVGEIYVGGPGLARGYQAAPALTAERFLPDPYSKEPGTRLYRTGDLARVTIAGSLQLLGRRDHQIKLRGYRIELGEVESALARHPDVVEVAVATFGAEASADRRLVAFFSATTTLPPHDLRDFVCHRLPDYMAPSTFVQLDALPRTPSGKLDRRALQPPSGAMVGDQTRHRPPRTAMQHAVAAIWQQVLDVERVGTDQNFFDLGGNSLLAVRVRGRLQEQLGIDLPLIELFRYTTVGSLADYLTGSHPATSTHSTTHGREQHYLATRHARKDLRKRHRASMEMGRGN